MKYLSIDVGLKNLAMCLIDDLKNIHEWEVGGVPVENPEVYQNLKIYLDQRPWVLDSDVVIIERQPDKNKRMKSIENFLHAYFIIHDKQTVLYHAKNKVPDVVGSGKKMYLRRKKVSIDRCFQFLQETNQHVRFFKNHKKQDDLADTVLQAFAYMNSTEETVTKKNKKMVPRKPTQNQKENKYSKANLAWIYKENIHRADKRFEKDLKRYYNNIQELIDEFELVVS